MLEERIGEVRVRVRTDVPDSAEIRPAAERLVRAALERCAALLEERFPGRVVMIQRLPLRWRLDESLLDDAAQIDELARAAADTIERIAMPSPLLPRGDSNAAVLFDNEAHLRASHLLALAREGPQWFHAAVEEAEAGDPLAALVSPDRRPVANAVLVRLANDGVLAEVLASRPPAAVVVFAGALGYDPRATAVAAAEGDIESTTPPTAVAELFLLASTWPPLPPAARSLALRVHAAILLNTSVESRAAACLAAAVLPGVPAPPSRTTEQIISDEPVTGAWRKPIVVSDPAPVEAAEDSGEIIGTRCAGLFFLLDRIQELDLAESLWKACLNEGAVLASAALALLGPDFANDPAPALFGGVTGKIRCPKISREQQSEIAKATCIALTEALLRRGLAEIPSATAVIVEHPAGKLLMVAADGSPFAFFSWPADTPDELRAGVRALLDIWPPRGILTAAPALAALDTTGRMHARRPSVHVSLLLPNAPSAAAAATLAIVAGAPCMLFASRAGDTISDTVESFVARHLALSADARLKPEQLEISLRSGDVNLEMRRAGLDRNPGWIPWLRRTVRFVYPEPV